MSYTFLQLEKEAWWTYYYWRDFKIELKSAVIKFWSRKARQIFTKAYNKYVEILRFLKELEATIW